jgi:glycosyltransferase involved in cell wall biosynthesis
MTRATLGSEVRLDHSARATSPRVLLVVNHAAFLVSHRLPVALAARARGYDVALATADDAVPHDAAAVRTAEQAGFRVHRVPFARAKAGVFAEWRAFRALVALYRRERPDLVHHVTIKPVLFGSVAARVAGVRAVVNAVSGLGFVFLATGWRAAIRRGLVVSLYRAAFGHRRAIALFQNTDDAEFLERRGVVRRAQVRLVRGSGVDLSAFTPAPPPVGPPVVVLPARLLGDKGVREFVAAATQLHAEGVTARFALVGSADDNPSAISADELARWAAAGHVEVWGHRSDMPDVLRQASIVCLPSYREGLPKALLEAQAAGRPVVTTDVPGCRDAIRPGVTGLLVPVRAPDALADALRRLLDDPAERARLGNAGRQHAEAMFDDQRLANATVDLYDELCLAPARMGAEDASHA